MVPFSLHKSFRVTIHSTYFRASPRHNPCSHKTKPTVHTILWRKIVYQERKARIRRCKQHLNQATRHPHRRHHLLVLREEAFVSHTPFLPLHFNYEISPSLMRKIAQQMASLQLLKSTLLTPASVPRPKLRLAGKSRDGVWRLRVSCKANDGEKLKSGNGEEPPESLFMKELRRRGMTPTSILEETKRTDYGSFNDGFQEERDFSKRNAVSTEPGNNLTNQREQSMALNSEGIEGLIPRAKLLLTLGGTFFLAFGPLIIVTVGLTLALYLYFGPSFIHDGTEKQVSLPQYIDPYTLLEEERISQIAPRVK